MTEETAWFLLSEDGRTLIARAMQLAEERTDILTALTRLRTQALPEHAQAAWELADLRRRAVAKFGEAAGSLYFVREAMEQASGLRVAAWHAQRFCEAGITSVTDLCGGIGGDALAFAAAGLRVSMIERDPVRAMFAQENARVLGLTERLTVRCADALTYVPETEAVWFDPARRDDDRRRVSSPEDYLPPLSFLSDLRALGVRNFGVKLSPAIDHRLATEYDAGLEFLSDAGVCKEALLWGGALREHSGGVRAIVVTPDGPQILAGQPDDAGAGECALPTGETVLYEPDPAVIRAHLVGTLASRLEAHPVDPQIAYLIGKTLSVTPFATPYQILEHFPYSRRALQTALDTRHIGSVIIKKRGFPLEPEAVRKQLKLRGTQEITVVLTRLGNAHHVFLCHPLRESAA